MDTFGNNGELPVGPVDPTDWGGLVEQHFQESLWQEEDKLWLQEVPCNNSAVGPVDPIDWGLVEQHFQESLWQEEDKLWLQEVPCNNSAATVAEWDIVQGDHRTAAANISAMQTQSEPVGGSTSAPKKIEIKVELWERLANKKSQYKFRVDPTNKVSVLRVLLVNKKAQLPEGYLFSYRMTVLNEYKSFLDQGMVGVGVPKLDVLDNVTNFYRH